MQVPRNRKPWAVLAYSVADDRGGGRTIDAAATRELMAMCDAADFGQVSVAVQVDFKNRPHVFRATLADMSRGSFEDADPENHPLWKAIQANLRRSKLTLAVNRSDLNAARAHVLADFLRYGTSACEAERQFIFFYGHSHGPLGLFYDSDPDDDATCLSLRLDELAVVLGADSRPVAIVAFRDCFMSTLEAAFELRHSAEFMIGSQSVVPIAGLWPWSFLMNALMPSASTGDQAESFARALARHLDDPANRGSFADAPVSLFDLAQADSIAAPLSALVHALDTARTDPRRCAACARALEAARVGDETQPGDPALLDVTTMCENLQRLAPDPSATPAAALAAAVQTRLVRFHHAQRARHKGASLYYQPTSAADKAFSDLFDEALLDEDRETYSRLALSAATGWHRIALNPLVPEAIPSA